MVWVYVLFTRVTRAMKGREVPYAEYYLGHAFLMCVFCNTLDVVFQCWAVSDSLFHGSADDIGCGAHAVFEESAVFPRVRLIRGLCFCLRRAELFLQLHVFPPAHVAE